MRKISLEFFFWGAVIWFFEWGGEHHTLPPTPRASFHGILINISITIKVHVLVYIGFGNGIYLFFLNPLFPDPGWLSERTFQVIYKKKLSS